MGFANDFGLLALERGGGLEAAVRGSAQARAEAAGLLEGLEGLRPGMPCLDLGKLPWGGRLGAAGFCVRLKPESPRHFEKLQ
jgi:hypothetical protein